VAFVKEMGGEDDVTTKKAGDAVAREGDMAEAVIPEEDLRLRDDWMASFLSAPSAILLRAGAKWQDLKPHP
jgi:hypothetical protein